jgi:hypothetical protein
MSDKDLTIADSKDLAPSFLGSYSGSTGFENISNDCISIPFLRLAQTNTPQASPGKDKIAGLSAGMYFNPSTGRVYEKAEFIILGFFRNFTVWHGEPPDSKFVKALSAEDFSKNYEAKTRRDEDSGKVIDSDGNRYVDTRNFLVLSATAPEDGIMLYGMASTGIPASKKWLAKASAIRVKDSEGNIVQAPMWSRVWELKPTFQEKKKGSFFQVTDIQDKGWIDSSIANAVKAAFEEAQGYDKSRIASVEKAEEAEPDWVK